jgi:hypothetical protein
LYNIQYFDNSIDTSSPKFPTIQLLVDFINQNPDLDYTIVLYNNEIVAYDTTDIILNKKPRRAFINYMTRRLSRT